MMLRSVVAECPDGPKTIAALKDYEPDLLLLDIQMPGADGSSSKASQRTDGCGNLLNLIGLGSGCPSGLGRSRGDFLAGAGNLFGTAGNFRNYLMRLIHEGVKPAA